MSTFRQTFTTVFSGLLMINWAMFLSVYTFELQYSCEPLVGQSICVPCAKVSSFGRFWHDFYLFITADDLPTCLDPEPEGGDGIKSPPIIGPDKVLEGSVIGSVAAVGAVVAGAPAVVAIGVGVAVWLAASALLSSIP